MDESFNMMLSINQPNANNSGAICAASGKSQTTPITIRYMKAFTLIELMVTLTILCVGLMVAIPAFRTMMQNNRLNSNSDSLVNTLNYARGIALNDGMNIRVCPLGAVNSTTCGNNWSAGWIVITQPATGTATLLKSQQNSDIGPTVTSSATSILFDSHGLATTQSNFALCDDRGSSFAHSITVQATGYVQEGTTPGLAVWNNSAINCP